MSLKNVAAKLPKLPVIQLPERFKGTIVERWANYWTGLARDYKDVAIDSIKTIRANPTKSTIYGSFAGLLYFSHKTNPDYYQLTQQLRKSQNDLAQVPESLQNPKTVEYLKFLERSKNNGTLRLTSLGIFSLMWIDDHTEGLSTFDARCEYLQPEYTTFHERILDIGWWNHFWNLEKMMKDYDINYE